MINEVIDNDLLSWYVVTCRDQSLNNTFLNKIMGTNHFRKVQSYRKLKPLQEIKENFNRIWFFYTQVNLELKTWLWKGNWRKLIFGLATALSGTNARLRVTVEDWRKHMNFQITHVLLITKAESGRYPNYKITYTWKYFRIGTSSFVEILQQT